MKNRELNLQQFVGRTSRSVSEAFRDAEYAISISRGRTEWDDAKDFIGHMLWLGPIIGLICYFIYVYFVEKGIV